MFNRQIFIGGAAGILLAGCVSTQEMPLAKNIVRLDTKASGALFVGGEHKATVKRAAQLTLQRGYKRFYLHNPQSSSDTAYIGHTAGYANTNVNVFGNTATANTTYTPGVPMYAHTAEVGVTVIMLNEGDAGFENALDAQQVLDDLKR